MTEKNRELPNSSYKVKQLSYLNLKKATQKRIKAQSYL